MTATPFDIFIEANYTLLDLRLTTPDAITIYTAANSAEVTYLDSATLVGPDLPWHPHGDRAEYVVLSNGATITIRANARLEEVPA